MKTFKCLLLLLCTVTISGCAKKEELSTKFGGDVAVYNKALAKFKKEQYSSAADMFEEIEENHPYSRYAAKAQIMAAFCFYQGREYAEAISILEMFSRLHPLHKYSPYALYLNGLCYEKQTKRVQCNQDNTMTAINVFEKLINQFPNTKYAKIARFRAKALEEILAIGEYKIGLYYLKRGFYPAAIARFQGIMRNFPRSYLLNEVKYRLVEIYLILGMNHFAKTYYKKLNKKWSKVAQRNFPHILNT